MNITEDKKVYSKEVARWLGVKHSLLMETIRKYYKDFVDFGYLDYLAHDYYLNCSHISLLIVLSNGCDKLKATRIVNLLGLYSRR